MTHDDMVDNIIATFNRATLDQIGNGNSWYPNARRIVEVIADLTNEDAGVVCHVMAALSPRNPWRWNVADTYAFCNAFASSDPMPSATTFGRNKAAAWRALMGQDVWTSAAPKVRAFVAAILGDRDAVVVDVWATRVATAGEQDHPRNDVNYENIATAYRIASANVGVAPRDLQAITWLVAQSEGKASKVRNHKAGTPAFIREMT